jgi:hypothetical protein
MSFDSAALISNGSNAIGLEAITNRIASEDGASASRSLGYGLHRGLAIDTEPETAQQIRQTVTGTGSPALSFDQVFTPTRVASASFSAGFIWWLTRGGGLLTSMLMGVPAWRHVDLLPVLARDFDEDDEDADDGLQAPLPRKPADEDSHSGITANANRARVHATAADINVEGLFERGPQSNSPHSALPKLPPQP